MAELISWETATDVATRIARRQAPMSPYDRRLMEAEFTELTAMAEELVAAGRDPGQVALASRHGVERGHVQTLV